MLKKLIRLNGSDLLLCGGVVGGTFLLLHIVTAIAVYFSGEGSSLLLSGILLPIVAGILILFVSAAHVAVTFDQALRFGQTRRRALGLTLGVSGLLALFSMGLAALLTALERLFAPVLWMRLTGAEALSWGELPKIPVGPDAPVVSLPASTLFIEDFSLDWWWFPLIALGCMALGIIIGAMVQRFGGRALWVFWAVWLLVCFAPQLLPWKQYTIVDWLFPLLGVFVLAAFLWSIWSLLHAVVKN